MPDKTMHRATTITTVTCPRCGAHNAEIIPEDACLYSFTCLHCGMTITPKPGSCCVICSYGSARCPFHDLASS